MKNKKAKELTPEERETRAQQMRARLAVHRNHAKAAVAPKGKPGRKASGMRGLSPEAARRVVSEESLKAVRQAAQLQGTIRKATPYGDAPTLERLLLDDVRIATVQDPDGEVVSFRPAIMAKSLEERLRDAGLAKRLAWVADRFITDVEQATIGKLTASYGEGLGGATAGEPERVFAAMQRLTKAQVKLTPKERTAAWGVLVFGLTMTDMGWALAGDQFRHDVQLRTASAIFLEGALERMAPVYEARG